ncbi:MAG TPA: pyrroloquinoline quinone biosynthesis protein PqqB [Xanthobacteraceae bacterium]|nr:pyrroloquinoline quinone biosynthesis protein PqqB [Xanthobacteraceae bacterium]
MTAIVLGAAAGGGFPQWNCRCDVCRLAWDGDPRVSPRTQASLAVSADGERWTLLNAAPDLRAQLAATPALHPHGATRASPIAAVVLTGAEVDQTAGLLNLRERQPFLLAATAETLGALHANTMFDVLASDVVTRRAIEIGKPFVLPGGLSAELFTVPGKVPLYLERGTPATAEESGSNVGVEIQADRARLCFVPGAAAVTPPLRARLQRADVVLFDGTLFADDEMIVSGTGSKTGRRMGHMPIDGADGSLAALDGIGAGPGGGVGKRRIYIHINNTNPILIDGSPQRLRVEAAGWEVAADGMEISL